jgi:hypothetical protein
VLINSVYQLEIHANTFARADLENSLQQGFPTRFSIEDIYRPAVVELLSSFKIRSDRTVLTVRNSQIFRQLSTNLQSVLMNITHLAWVLNDAHADRIPKLCGYAFHETILLLGYDLIRISPLGGPRPTSHLDNVVHLGLTAFIMTFFRGLDGETSGSRLLSDLARSAIQQHCDSVQEDQELLLWLLFIKGASVFGQMDDAWSIAKTAETMQTLDLHTWEDVAQTISNFPWVGAVHDKAGQLYHAISCSTLLLEATSK